jgi:hypothetical protein
MDVQVQVVHPATSGISANAVTNTWAFMDFVAGDEVGLTTALKNFYDGVGSQVWSNQLATGSITCNWYEKPGLKPNYPFAQTTFTRANPPAGTPMPSELAICLSFQGLRASGAPQARRRGRVYLGPLGTVANTNGLVAPATVTSIIAAATAFKTAVNALASGVSWAIWSSTDNHAVPVLNGWVDNAFDVQRRRGIDAGSKTTFT